MKKYVKAIEFVGNIEVDTYTKIQMLNAVYIMLWADDEISFAKKWKVNDLIKALDDELHRIWFDSMSNN